MTVAVLRPDASHVLFKAFFNATDELKLSQQVVADMIGVERSSISRLRKRGELDPKDKKGELALIFLRIYRALYAMFGGDQHQMQHWLTTHNLHLQGEPKVMITTAEGLVNVCQYLDAMRGRI
ncbi:DUF2384 domain-containing protein [bacterium]|nr:DUF2384 domain-containing protein [bacterium]